MSEQVTTKEQTAPNQDAGRHLPGAWTIPAYSLLILVAGLLAYANSFECPFLFDDDLSIIQNPHIRRLWPISEALRGPPQSGVAGRPVLGLTLAINYALGNLNPWGYHAFNLGVHLAAGLLLFGVARRTLLSERLRPRYGPLAGAAAGITALIWVVHPLQTESVTYIIQRAESLMGLFYLLTLYCAIRARTAPKPHSWQVTAIAACALGMATKEVMVTAPLVVLLHDAIFGSGSIRGALRNRPTLYVGLTATWAIPAMLMLSGPRSASIGFAHDVTATQYALNQCNAIMEYLRLAFWPHPLVFDYGPPNPLPLSEAVTPAVILTCLLAATVIALIRRPALGFLGCWFFVILGPTSSFVPITTQVAAEHRVYLPLAAVIMLVVAGVHAVLTRLFARLSVGLTVTRAVVCGLAAAAVCTLGAVTHSRNEVYQNGAELWGGAVIANPRNARAHNNLATNLLKQAAYAAAEVESREAIRLQPDYEKAYLNLGAALAGQGRMEEAVRCYQEALRNHPPTARLLCGYATALGRTGRDEAAITQLRAAIRLDPQYLKAMHNLAVLLVRRGETDEPLALWSRAIKIDPAYLEARRALAHTLGKLGRTEEAIRQFREILRQDPQDTVAQAALHAILRNSNDASRN